MLSQRRRREVGEREQEARETQQNEWQESPKPASATGKPDRVNVLMSSEALGR
jgi:hypothetical protein